MRRVVALVLLSCFAVCWPALASDPLDPSDAPAAVRRAVFRAEAAFNRDQVEEAVGVLQGVVDGGVDHPAVRYRLGAYLLEMGRAAEALPQLEAASGQAPSSAPVWADLGRAAFETGDHARAADAFGRAHGAMAAPDPALLYYSGVSWLLADQPGRSVDVLAPLVSTVADTVPREWVQALVSAAAAADEPARAADAVQRLVRDHPDARSAWRLASQQAQLAEDYEAAALRLQVADWLAPLDAAERRNLADLYGAAGLPRLAARQYARLWPADRRLTRPLAVSWVQAHEPDSARVVLEQAVAWSDEPVALWMLLGDVEYEAERWEAARRAYAQASTLDPEAARAWLMQGACAVRLEDMEGARSALERAAGFARTEGEARRLLGQIAG